MGRLGANKQGSGSLTSKQREQLKVKARLTKEKEQKELDNIVDASIDHEEQLEQLRIYIHDHEFHDNGKGRKKFFRQLRWTYTDLMRELGKDIKWVDHHNLFESDD